MFGVQIVTNFKHNKVIIRSCNARIFFLTAICNVKMIDLIRASIGFYLEMQGWLFVTLLVAREVEISLPDAQSHSLGLIAGFKLQIGRHGQVN